jgi:hypothetical protein
MTKGEKQMNSLAEIQTAIAQLPLAQVHQLTVWLEEYLAVAADLEPETELTPTSLEEKLRQARAEIKARQDAHHHP